MDVGENGEPLADEGAGGRQRLYGVREEIAGVGDHLQLNPVGARELAGQAGGEQRLVDGTAAGGVGEEGVPLPVKVIHQVGFIGLVEGEAADGHGDDLGAGGVDGVAHLFHAAPLAGADDEARAERLASDG